jgi:hypothetical protein
VVCGPFVFLIETSVFEKKKKIMLFINNHKEKKI